MPVPLHDAVKKLSKTPHDAATKESFAIAYEAEKTSEPTMRFGGFCLYFRNEYIMLKSFR